MSTNVTAQQVIAEVRRMAAAAPGYVYEPVVVVPQREGLNPYTACRYLSVTEPTKGGCIFGHAMLNLGFSPNDIETVEGGDAEYALRNLGVHATETEQRWMNSVQGAQDTRIAWGEAVLHADKSHPLT